MNAAASRITLAIAHIAGDGQAQPLLEHLTAVSTLCGGLAAKIGLARAGALIGLLHDLGKQLFRVSGVSSQLSTGFGYRTPRRDAG